MQQGAAAQVLEMLSLVRSISKEREENIILPQGSNNTESKDTRVEIPTPQVIRQLDCSQPKVYSLGGCGLPVYKDVTM